MQTCIPDLLLAYENLPVKCSRFKLHMRPSDNSNFELLRLPQLKSVIDVFADFMRYLYTSAKTYINETNADANGLWTNAVFVLTHPNDWEGVQQERLRKAAVLGGLIPDTTSGHERIQLVTEGEASLHFCIDSGLATEAIDVRISCFLPY